MKYRQNIALFLVILLLGLLGCNASDSRQLSNIAWDASPMATVYAQIQNEPDLAIPYYSRNLIHARSPYDRLVAARALLSAGRSHKQLPQNALDELARSVVRVNNMGLNTYFLASPDDWQAEYQWPAKLRFAMDVDGLLIELPWRETLYYPLAVSSGGDGWTFEVTRVLLDGRELEILPHDSRFTGRLQRLLPEDKWYGPHEWTVTIRLIAPNGQSAEATSRYRFKIEKMP